jgi:hypothetical protein
MTEVDQREMTVEPLALNPALDIQRHARIFREQTRVQVRDFLDEASALRLRSVLEHETQW